MNSPTANNSCSGFFIRIKKGREQKMVKISFIASGIILGLATISSASASLISRSFLDQALTDYATTTALDLKANQSDLTALSNKIGTLPSGEIIPSKGLAFLLPDTDYTYPTSIGDFMEQMYDGYWGISVLAEAVYYGNEFMGQTDTTRQVKGLRQITDEIGTLPSGNFPEFPGYELLFPYLNQPLTYPTSLAELITAIYGNSKTGAGLLGAIIAGFPVDTDGDGQFDSETGIIFNHNLAKDAIYLANANATKIGMLPPEIVIGNSNGSIDMFNITKRQSVSLPKDYTLSDFIQDMYYGSFGSNAGLDSSPFYGLSDIIDHVMYGGITGEASPELTGKQYKGLIDLTLEINKIGDLPTPDTTVAGMMGHPVLLNREQTIIPLYDLILWGSNGQIVMNPITGMTMPFPLLGLHDITAKVNKIGDLPTEYATVGAALTAMKSDIDAKNLPSTSDDGQYVLSAKKVGDTITYTWVKMDLTNEEQAQ